MALSGLNRPCGPKAAIGIGKRTLGHPRQSATRRGGAAARLRQRPLSSSRSGRDILALSMPVDDPSRKPAVGRSNRGLSEGPVLGRQETIIRSTYASRFVVSLRIAGMRSDNRTEGAASWIEEHS
jgi:hypothetical protein